MGRYSGKPFSSLWDSSWNERVDMKILEKDYIEDLRFDENNNRLVFTIKHLTRKPKITRYVTSNYKRTPVYEGYSERSRIVKKFDKIINPLRFVNKEILSLEIDREFILFIIEEIGIIPQWRKKELKLEEINNEITKLLNSKRSYGREKQEYNFKETDYQEYPSNKWIRILLAPLTFGISLFWLLPSNGYVSKNQALLNIDTNKANKKWNKKHKIKIDKENVILLKELNNFNDEVSEKINVLNKKYIKINDQEIILENIDDDGWKDIKNSSIYGYKELENKKGVYIIWNKTKDKYYVGQSKNIAVRLKNHFKDGEVQNIIFAKDAYNNDEFVYKYFLCQTKDELDRLEKRYIEEYNAFENGYNGTGGNR